MRGADASALPSIYIPPWAGGEPFRAGPLGVPGALQAPVDPRGLFPNTGPHLASSIGPESQPHPRRHGTSTNCSAVCGTGRDRQRGGRERLEILGTSISCSGTGRSTIFSTSSNLSTSCGTGASSSGTTGTQSTVCSMVRRCTRSCGPDTSSRRWPGAPGGRHIIHVHRTVHGACRLGKGRPPDLRRKVQLEILLPGPGLLLSPWG